MFTRKRIFAVAIIFAILAANLSVQQNPVQAARKITVIIDNTLLNFVEADPQIINGSTVVPFRPVGDAMGATTDWDDATKTVSMYLNGQYVKLSIGNSTMTYGFYITDTSGLVTPVSTGTEALTVAPLIVNEKTLVPLRALSQGLGATVDWYDSTSTVSIKPPLAPTAQPVATPTPTPTGSPTSTTDPFTTTSYFKEITPRRAQAMYNANEAFILAVYNSGEDHSKNYMPKVKDAARYSGSLVYGVDLNDSYTSESGYLSFIWDYTRKDKTQLPLIFLVYGEQDVTSMDYSYTQSELERQFTRFMDYTTYASPSPTSTSSSSYWGNYWTDISFGTAQNYYNDSKRFIYVVYDSQKGDSDLLDKVKTAVGDTRVNVYATNRYNYTANSNHFIWNYTDVDAALTKPVIFLVSSSGRVQTLTVTYSTDVAGYLKDF